ESLDHEVALGRDDIASDPAANNLANALGDPRLAFHQGMEVVGVQHQEAGSRDRGNGGRAPRAAQRRHLAEEVASAEPDTLVLERDLDLAGGDAIHRM